MIKIRYGRNRNINIKTGNRLTVQVGRRVIFELLSTSGVCSGVASSSLILVLSESSYPQVHLSIHYRCEGERSV